MLISRTLLFLFLAGDLSYAAISALQILQIPSQPQQTIDYVTTDPAGSLIATGHGGNGAFIDKLDSSGNLIFTFSSEGAYPYGAAADANGDVYWVGASGEPVFPFPFTNTALGPPPSGSVSGFVVKFRGTDGSIVWATALGAVVPSAIAIDANGRATVAGIANSSTPVTTPGAYTFSSVAPNNPVEIVQLSADGDLVFAGTFGGNTVNGTALCFVNPLSASAACPAIEVASVMVDPEEHIWIAGSTNTTDIPITATALTRSCVCGNYASDGYLAELSTDGSSLLYASYVAANNASGIDKGTNIASAAIDSAGHVWMAGSTPDNEPVIGGVAGQSDGLLVEYDPVANQILLERGVITGPGIGISSLAVSPSGVVAFAGNPAYYINGVRSTGAGFAGTLTFGSTTALATTSLPQDAIGTGLAFTPSGAFVVSGSASVATVLEESDGSAAPNVLWVANSAVAGAAGGQVSPGEIISIFGTGLGPEFPGQAGAPGPTLAFPIQLAGVQVFIGGIAAPLLYVSGNQINAIVPFGVTGMETVNLAVIFGNQTSDPVLLGVVPAMPGVFTTLSQYQNYPVAAALNQDGTINSETNRAAPGSIVSVFASGLGTLSSQPADGVVLSGPALPTLNQSVDLASGAQFLDIFYADPAPDEVAGMMQINFRLPATVTGTPPILMFVGEWLSEYFTVWVSGT